MATITEVISLMREVAEADPQIPTFIYDKVWTMNEQRDKKYPVLLVDDSPEIDLDMAGKQRYRLRLFFFDTYQRDAKYRVGIEEKQGDLLLIAQAYLLELRNRAISVSGIPVGVAVVSNQAYENRSFFAKDVFNDMLIQLTVTIEFLVTGSCQVVIFDYE